ncbi:MAG: hypothetical protein RLZZ59_549 [Pseudomonadota bacterium]|jgi:4-aminobutyrate aminotransferase-like enzyme
MNNTSKIIEKERLHFKHGISSTALYSNLVLSHGKGVYLEDAEGNEYIDLFAGAGIAALGHSHPKFIQGLKEQLDKFIVGSYTTPVRAEYIDQLCKLLPEDLSQISFFSAGTESNEAALKLARNYTQKRQVVSFWGGYHGRTAGVSALSDPSYGDPSTEIIPGTIRVPYPDNYRRLSASNDETDLEWILDFIKQSIAKNSTEGIAAVIVEPIQGTAGNVIPVKGFLKALRKLTIDIGALLIVDEIITGFGRTGSSFCFQQEEIVPDILVIGKAMGNGVPISAVVTNEKIAAVPSLSKPSGLSSSFGGNPFSLKAAQLSLEIIEEEKLIENASKVGDFWLEKLQEECGNYPFVGDIRGKGLMLGIELVDDKKSKAPLNSKLVSRLFDLSIKNGIIGSFRSPHLRLNPPLIFSEEHAREATKKIKQCFNQLSKEMSI